MFATYPCLTAGSLQRRSPMSTVRSADLSLEARVCEDTGVVRVLLSIVPRLDWCDERRGQLDRARQGR